MFITVITYRPYDYRDLIKFIACHSVLEMAISFNLYNIKFDACQIVQWMPGET